MKHTIVLSLIAIVLISVGSHARAAKDGPMAKVGFELAGIYYEHESYTAEVRGAIFMPRNPLLRVVDGYVVIDAVAAHDIGSLRADLERLGLKKAVTFGSMISGLLPVTAIDDLAALENLKFARPAYAKTNVGRTTSQGDAAMRADIARGNLAVDGSGITLGVLSDSFDCFGQAADDVASGDLPVDIIVLADLPDFAFACAFFGTDEGRALMQIGHDVAPGAKQAFHTSFGGEASFAQGIIDLATVAGANVIVDDVIFFTEPMFQDGIIAQAVDTVVGMGVSYFSSAGNSARAAYDSSFAAGGAFAPDAFPSPDFFAPPFSGGTAHDFDPGLGVDVFQKITVPEGSGVIIAFHWDDPFFSVSGAPGAETDMDMYILDDPPTTVLAGGVDNNILGGDPVEVFFFVNPFGSGRTEFNAMLLNFDGANPELMKYVIFPLGTEVNIEEFDTASGTLYGHANAAGAEAVGAAFYANTPAFGVDPAVLEPFSSGGPTPILFKADGTPTFELRHKPEIVGPDGTNTTFFGFDVEPDGFPNFFGTSAAAPHAAGVAALMLEAAPALSPSSLYATLESTAADMGAAGFDFDSGFGLIQADRAVAGVLTNCRGVPATIVGTAGNDYLWGTPNDDVIVGLGGNDVILGLGGDDLVCGGAGNDLLFGGRANDTLDGGAGKDLLLGGLDDDTLYGDEGRDFLFGMRGRDALDGGDARDLCIGGAGLDSNVNCERVY